MPERMVRSVPVPSSSVNLSSFLDLGTASHASTLTARKSDFENVSKSTVSSNSGSILTLEKSIFSSTTGAVSAGAAVFSDFLSASRDLSVGIFVAVLSFAALSCFNGH